MATCSSDQKIKIWDHVRGKWSCTAEIKAHSGSVHAVSWAHPEFGQVLASCSSDRVVHIYEEQVDGRTGARAWKKQGRLVDSRDSVQDCQFAPRHLGLKLATCSLDGRVRIYESNDVMNLSVWPLVEEFDAAKSHAAALSWNSSPFDPPMLCVAAEREVRVWEYNANARKWLAVASLDGHADLVHDVCWAPNLGRAYHLVATACKDACVRIFKLSYSKLTASYAPTLVAKLAHHSAEVWRVSWNVSGTILASTGDDGVSRLWKSDFNGTWHPILVAAATPAASAAATTINSAAAAAAAAGGAAGVQGQMQQLQSQQQQLQAATAASSQQQPHPSNLQSNLAPNLSRFQSAPGSAAAAAASPFYAAPSSSSSSGLGGAAAAPSASPFASAFGSGYNRAPLGGGGGGAASSSMFGAINESKKEEEVKFADHRSFN